MSRLLELYKERQDAVDLRDRLEARREERSDDESSPAHRVQRAISDVNSRIKEIEEEISDERDRASRSGS